MKLRKIIVSLVLTLVLIFNLYSVISRPQLINTLKSGISHLSVGDNYYYRLRLWYLFAADNDWNAAKNVAAKLDPSDTEVYRLAHDPLELKKNLNSLVFKPNKSSQDWLELGRIQYIVGKTTDAKNSFTQAHQLDPVNSDISRFYFGISEN
jgi:hypothetical protein